MKIKGLLLGMFACAALASCTNNDLVEENGTTPELKGNAYVTVKLSMSGNSTSGRAFGDDGFQKADKEEVAVTAATFFFLDEFKNGCAEPCTLTKDQLKELNEEWTDGSESIDKKSSPVVVIKNQINTPKYIVAILNTGNPFSGNVMPSLEQLRNVFGDYTSEESGTFVMSNSVYVEDGDIMDAVEITAENIKATADEAKAEGVPVVIPVERVLAKVTMDDTSATTDIDQEGVDNLTVEITGWWLDNTNPTSYLIKKNPSLQGTWWNDANNHRSYWANAYASEDYTHRAYKNKKEATSVWYCQENTSANPTQFVLAAQLKVNGNATTLIQFRKQLYTEDTFKSKIAKEFNSYRVEIEGKYISIEGCLGFDYNKAELPTPVEGLEDWQAVVTVTDPTEGKLVQITTNQSGEIISSVTAADVQASIRASIPNVKMWKDGMTYYFTQIEHNKDVEAAKYGIIRNHLYKLNVTKISGLGTPVPNPDITIIPVIPGDDEESYLAAEIEILSYKVVPTQIVEF